MKYNTLIKFCKMIIKIIMYGFIENQYVKYLIYMNQR